MNIFLLLITGLYQFATLVSTEDDGDCGVYNMYDESKWVNPHDPLGENIIKPKPNNHVVNYILYLFMFIIYICYVWKNISMYLNT